MFKLFSSATSKLMKFWSSGCYQMSLLMKIKLNQDISGPLSEHMHMRTHTQTDTHKHIMCEQLWVYNEYNFSQSYTKSDVYMYWLFSISRAKIQLKMQHKASCIYGMKSIPFTRQYAVKVRHHTPWSHGPLSWIPGMLVHTLSILLSISFAMAQSSHNSEIYKHWCTCAVGTREPGKHDYGASDVWTLTAYSKETPLQVNYSS